MVQLQILSRVLQTKDNSLIEDNNLTEDFFEEYKDEYNFIENHVREYGNVPDIATFLSNFKDIELADVAETDRYLINTIREEYLFQKTIPTLKKMSELMQTDSNTAVEYMAQQLQMLQPSYDIQYKSLTKNKDRLEQYKKRRENPQEWFFETGFKELDDIIHGIQRSEELFVIVARTNQCKCLAKGTKVMMADGTLKAVEDVKVGDYVQSLNGANRVEYLHNGISNGYKIIPKVGEPFIVSSQHILTLKVLKETWDRSRGKRGQTITNNEFELVDVQIEDYLKWSGHKKHLSKLYRPAIEYTEKEQTIPPYILGSWLGDGNSNNREVAITNIDEEILNEWADYAKLNSLELNRRKNSITYCISGGIHTKNKPNIILNRFRELGVMCNGRGSNKHIPLNYLTGSREQRLELLAGLIDTDGTYCKSGRSYAFTFKLYDLTMDAMQLCRGLGFKVGKLQVMHNKQYNKDYYAFSFSGDLSIIPVRVSRKKCTNMSPKQTEAITGFRVEPVDVVEYYGFQTDGDHRFLLWDNTLTHNTWVLQRICTHVWKLGFNVGYFSPEMSDTSLGFRFDTLFNHYSNISLMRGAQDIDTDEYEKYLDTLAEKDNDFVVTTPKDFGYNPTVSSIKHWIKQAKLDIVAIDGITYLNDERAKRNDSKTVSLTNISEDLMALSVEMHVPILVVVQANRGGVISEDDGTPELESIRDSDGIAHNASTVISIRYKKDNVLEMGIKKSRNGVVGGRVCYNCDINTGAFSYLPTDDTDSGVTRKQSSDTKERKQTAKEDVF